MVTKYSCRNASRWLLLAAALFLFALSANAQGSGPGFHAAASGSSVCPWAGGTASSLTDPVSVGPFLNMACLGGTSSAGARAGKGTLGTYADAARPCCGSATGAGAQARFRVDDLVISGPSAPGGVTVTLTLHLKGTLFAQQDGDGAFVSVQTVLQGFNTNLASTSQMQTVRPNVPVKNGIFDPLSITFPTTTIDQDFTLFLGSAVPNTPLIFEVAFFAQSGSPGSFSQIDFFNGSNGLTLAVGPPVFGLPAGYTVNNSALNIVDNHFGIPPAPDVSVNPASVNFGSVPIGTQSSTVVTVSNTGGPGLNVNSAGLSGSVAFSISAIRKGGTNVSLPVSLAGGETADVELLFNPSAVGGFSGSLDITSNDADEGLVQVPLSGQGTQVQVPPGQQIASILAFMDSAVQAGTLTGAGAGNSAAGRLKALRNMIEAAGDFINAGNRGEACRQLLDVLNRIDGNPNPPDFAAGSSLPELRNRVIDLRASLGCA